MNSYLLKNASLYRNQKFENVDILIVDGVETSKSQSDIFEYLQSDVVKSWVDVSNRYLSLCS